MHRYAAGLLSRAQAVGTVAWLAMGGFVAACVAVVAGGQAGTVSTTTPLTTWLGLLSPTGYQPGGSWLPALLLFVGIAALVLLWLQTVRLAARAALGERQVWWIALAWSAPFVIGPPLISKDVFSYAAQGLMVRSGLDPYASGVSALGVVPSDAAAHIVSAVDPTWRSSPSPYGPLATTLEHLAIAISGGSPLGAVIALRGLAVLSVIVMGILAMQLAEGSRAQALVLVVLNPLVLVHLVSGAHLEAPMCALLLGSLVAAKRHKWAWAVCLACAAGSVKAPAFAAVLVIVAAHALAEPTRRARLVAALRDTAVAVASVGGLALLVSNHFGWIAALNTPAQGYTPFAPASLVGDLFKPVVASASFDNLAAGGRVSCLLAALCIVIHLSVTAGQRSIERGVGFALVAIAVLSPAIYPWYLLWGALCLAANATGRLRDWLVVGCGVMSVVAITGAPGPVTATFDGLAVLAAAALLWRSSRKLVAPGLAG